MFYFGMTKLCIISGCISLNSSFLLFVIYAWLVSSKGNTLSRAGFSLLFQFNVQTVNMKI